MKFVLANFAVSFLLIAPGAFGQQMEAGKFQPRHSLMRFAHPGKVKLR